METKDNLLEADGKKEKESNKNDLDLSNDSIQESDKKVELNIESLKSEFESMDLESLVQSFEEIIKKDNIQQIRPNVNKIKKVFNSKFNQLLNENKKKFIEEGGNIIDFNFSHPQKKKFNTLSKVFREKNELFEKKRIETYKKNLQLRLQIIDSIKNLIDTNLNTNKSYNEFRDLQDQWREIGKVPLKDANNVWNNYRHHVERFYDFLHLDRDLRERDYKYNFEKKSKLIEKANSLSKETNLGRAFRELQALHKIWKEELGPVAKEHRINLWNEFSNATKAINEKRKIFNTQIEEKLVENLKLKEEIINKIKSVSELENKTHTEWQNKIKEIENLRKKFLKIGNVPRKQNNKTWTDFKTAVRVFNKNKNNFYKKLKKEQADNLRRKQELTEIAEKNKDNNNLETTVVLMKKIQNQWKEIGHIPRKESNKLWKRFRTACNEFFDRYHEQNISGTEEEIKAFNDKEIILESLKSFEFGKQKKANYNKLKEISIEWAKIGNTPRNKKFIDKEFNKIINSNLKSIGAEEEEINDLKYYIKLNELTKNPKSLNNELQFVKNKVGELKSQINQFENNLQFFSNVDMNNPMIIEVNKKIENHKYELKKWTDKINKINKIIK
jgi:hypothetical protein